MKIQTFAFASLLSAALLASPAGAESHRATGAAAADAHRTTGELPPLPAPGESATPGSAGTQAASEAAGAVAPSPAPAPTGSVGRAQFALDVTDREPSEAISELTNDHDRILFFTELHRFQGQELVHRWEFNGEVMAEVPFGVDGPRWRVYSSKQLDPAWLGTWTVSVVDAAGHVVEEQRFDFKAAPEVARTLDEEVPPPAAPAEAVDTLAPTE